jgi:hypothetical protein
MAREELLNSARHKLRLARYHGATLANVLAASPPDDPEDDLRIALEAHLEGLAYTGTAAAEKTLRSVNPEAFDGQQASVERMVRTLVTPDLDDDTRAFLRGFEGWWVGRGRQTHYAQAARDLRNDAAHTFYDKTPDGNGRLWFMHIRGGRGSVEIEAFRVGYLQELGLLEPLVAQAEALAAAVAG